jgi:DNA-directed RNA polymerase specialized sigma24 family protein
MPLRAVGPEDVAAQAFASFCLRLEQGGFTPVADRDDLWRLLTGIVLNKALQARRHHRAKKRGEGTVRGESAWARLEGGPDGNAAGIDGEEGKDLPADFLAEANEEFQRRLDELGDKTLRKIALWRLEGDSNEEIAARLGVMPRTVERKLNRIRSIWRPKEDVDEQ